MCCYSTMCVEMSQDEQDQREEQRKKKEGLFQRTGRFRRSTSPPSRTLSLSLSHNRHHDSTLPSMDPSPSVTLLSLSSLSDCNSTKSLLPSDPDDFAPTPSSALPVVCPAPSLNPLLDLRAESFKREPNQSLTPTHISAAMALNRGHRRTPSDGAIRPRAQTVVGHRRTPSDGSMPFPPAQALTITPYTGTTFDLKCYLVLGESLSKHLHSYLIIILYLIVTCMIPYLTVIFP